MNTPQRGTNPWSSAAVILAVVLINALIGAFQEGRAERSMSALRRLAAKTALPVDEGVEPAASLPSAEAARACVHAAVPKGLVLGDTARLGALSERLLGGSAGAAIELCGDHLPVLRAAPQPAAGGLGGGF